MISIMVLPAGLAILGLAAQALGQIAVCDYYDRPDWDACAEIMSNLEAELGSDHIVNDCDARCIRWTLSASANCRVAVCFRTDRCDQFADFSTMSTAYGVIDQWCGQRDGSGGYSDSFSDLRFTVDNNPDFSGSSLLEEMIDDGAVVSSSRAGSDLQSYTMPLEVYEALVAQERAQTPNAVTARRVPGKPAKRQDGEWRTFSAGVGPNTDLGRRVTDALSSGVEFQWSFSETITVGVEVSAEMSAGFFGIFTATVGISASMETSETVETGMSYTVEDCPSGEGYVYWEPIMNWWTGYFTDDPDTWYDIWVPRLGVSGNGSDGRFRTQCLGL